MNILNSFISETERMRLRIHGAVIMHDGKVTEEIYKGRYSAKTLTRMYSTSKSVAAVAIGRLIGEGKLSLDDRIVDIFSDRFDMSRVHPYMKEQTIRQMLCMTTCLSTPSYDKNCKEWLASYFAATPTHPAGTVWNYDSSGSYVLGAVVKHITGLDFVEYLRPVFDEIGVSPDVYCLKGPDGEAWASSGFMATTSDLAKIAYLLMAGGKWNGKQLIPEDYAHDAISPLVRNGDATVESYFDCGYGYQIWSHPGGAFAFRGLGGQIAVAYPEYDLVFACNADTAAHHNAYDEIFYAVESIILPKFKRMDNSPHKSIPPMDLTHTVFEKIKGVRYTVDSNPMGIESVCFDADGERMLLNYLRHGKPYTIPFSFKKETHFVFPEKYTGTTLFSEDHYMNYECTSIGHWYEPSKLYISIYAEDIYVGNMSMCFAFRGNVIGIKMDKCAQFFFDGYVGFAGGRAEA